jgi:hypothetical protein
MTNETCSNDIFDSYPQGYWKVKEKKFINKYDALLLANKCQSNVDYVYFDHVWEKFDRTLLGKYSLNYLYSQRAQQLRDQYDYLILYFSGGADSYNVLRSFIDNNIHLDEVCVKWAKSTYDSHTKIYSPNTTDHTAYNYLSEWDYAIVPILDYLSKYHPKIKITILDWFEDKKIFQSADVFQKVNHWHDIEVSSLAIWSPSEQYFLDQGKKVASIYGIDKPTIYFDAASSYMIFSDAALCMGTPNTINPFGTEYFYYSPSFPELTFEMANVAAKSFETDPILKNYKFTSQRRHDSKYMSDAHQIQQKRLRHILYTTWTDRFQTLKPMLPNRQDKHFWIYQMQEISNYKEMYEDMRTQHLNQLAGSWYLGNNQNKNITTDYTSIYTKKHIIW